MRYLAAVSLGLLLAACSQEPSPHAGWDQTAPDGPPAQAALLYVDVLSTEPAAEEGTRYLSGDEAAAADDAADDDADVPVAQFALWRDDLGGQAITRIADAAGCGDRLVSGAAGKTQGKLLGYASPNPASGTDELVELLAPAGGPDCAPRYETDADEIAEWVAQGYSRGETLGYVWPPGWGTPDDDADENPADAIMATAELKLPAPRCNLGKHPALILYYASVGGARLESLLAGCPGEVVIGDKRDKGPTGPFTKAVNKANGGRTAYVMDNHGLKLLDMLRDRGTRDTVAHLNGLLRSGYDYILIDEITANPRWADSSLESQRLRKALRLLPKRKVIAYVSLDLTMQSGGATYLANRKKLLTDLHTYGRAASAEVYLKTSEVLAGEASGAFRRSANRLGHVVRGMNSRVVTTLGITVKSIYAYTQYVDYQYLNEPSQDLRSIKRQVNALRHASHRLRAQPGVGYYFVNTEDLTPNHSSPYDTDGLVARLHHQSLRFRSR